MKDESSPVKSDYCYVCRFPLKLLKIRTPAEHIQKCKERKRPQSNCRDGIYCQSRMESHYRLLSHEDPPTSGGTSVKSENKNNFDAPAFPCIDLTDSQTSSEDFLPPMTSSIKNKSNFFKSSQKSKISSMTHPGKRKSSKDKPTSCKQVKKKIKLKTENVSFSLNSTQTPFTIALQQRRRKKSKVSNCDSIDLTQEFNMNDDEVFSKNSIWKHSKIVDLCDSSSSEADRPFVVLHNSPKKLKRSSCLERHENSKKVKHSNFDSKDNSDSTGCVKIGNNATKSSETVTSNCRSHVRDSNVNDQLKNPIFQSTQASNSQTHSSVPSTLDVTLDSEDFPTPPPTGPGFAPMTPIIRDKTAKHGFQTDSEEDEEDLFSTSPSEKEEPKNKLINAVPNSDPREGMSSKNPKPGEEIQGKKAKDGPQNRCHVIDQDGGKLSDQGTVDNEDSKVTKSLERNKEGIGLQTGLEKEQDFVVNPLEISSDGSLDETISKVELNPSTTEQSTSLRKRSSNVSADTTLEDYPLMHRKHFNEIGVQDGKQDTKMSQDSVNEMTPIDEGLSFSESEQDDYLFLDFASADATPFTGPPNVLKDLQSNSLVNKEGDATSIEKFECESVILHHDSRTFSSSSSSLPSDNNNNVGEKPFLNFEEVSNREEISAKAQESVIDKIQPDDSKNNSAVSDDKSSYTAGNGHSKSHVNQSNSQGSIKSGSLVGKILAPVFSNSISNTRPVPCTTESQFSASHTALTNSANNPSQNKHAQPSSSRTMHLLSPKNTRVVQRHPIQSNTGTAKLSKCARELDFNDFKSLNRTNQKTDKDLKASGSEIPNSKPNESKKMSTATELVTEDSILSTYVDRRNSKVKIDIPSHSGNFRPGTQSPDQTMLDFAELETQLYSGIVDHNTPEKSCPNQTTNSSKFNVNCSETKPENVRSNSSKIQTNSSRPKLTVQSNMPDCDNIQSGQSSEKSSVDSLAEENVRKGKKQGDIGSMLFGMKPMIRTEHEISMTQRIKRFRDGSRGYSNKPRSCPFYKKITGTDIAVDAFRYGLVPGINYYFLSHFHFDHYMGLERHGWKEKIFCGQVTGNLLAGVLKIPENLIIRLPLCQEIQIGEVRVTLLDANHCPGAVIILFKLKNNKVILHTGDFRATPEMEQYLSSEDISISTLYLDTTYLSPEHCFPPQTDVVEEAVAIARRSVEECDKTLFVVGSYDIGKEKIFISIAKALGSKIYIIPRKMNILKQLNNEDITNIVTTKVSNSCKVHVMPLKFLNLKYLKSMLEKQHFFKRIVGIKPTGWTQGKKMTSLNQIKPAGSGKVKLYGLPYSEHSSFDELRRFVKFVKPKQIIPTVNAGRKETRDKMNRYLNAWKHVKDFSDN